MVQLPRPKLPGDHQIENAGTAVAALRHLGFNDEVCEAAVSQAHWPARMQKLNTGPIIDSAPVLKFGWMADIIPPRVRRLDIIWEPYPNAPPI